MRDISYKLEVNGEGATEILYVNGKEFKREYKSIYFSGIDISSIDISGVDFSEALDDEGLSEEMLDEIYDILDTSFFVSDVIKICKCD